MNHEISYTRVNDKYGDFEVIRPCLPFCPKVSVLLSAYNAEDTIFESIQSLRKQSLKEIEILITDDGSKDSTANILEQQSREDERIVVIKQKNLGLTKSLNRMIKLAKGEYIARQDADDTSSLDRLKKQFDYCKHSGIPFVTSRYLVQSNSPFVGPKNYSLLPFKIWMLYFNNVYAHGTFFFKRDLKLTYDDNIKYAQDFDFIVRYHSQFKAIPPMMNECLYNLRISDDSLSFIKSSEQIEFVLTSLKTNDLPTSLFLDQFGKIKKLFLKLLKLVLFFSFQVKEYLKRIVS